MAEQTGGSSPEVTSPRRREQWRQHYAMLAIDAVPAAQKDAYQGRAQNLPAMIQNMGLAGTLAFLLSKTASDQRLARDLSTWLLLPEAGIGWTTGAKVAGNNGVWRAIGHPTTTARTYRRAATEAKHFGVWLKRWSKAEAAANQPGDQEPADGAA